MSTSLWRTLSTFGCVLVVLLYGLFLYTPINVVNADIGRHIMNGQVILEQAANWKDVLYTNFYAYTHPDFPVINHHWGSGIIFALAQQFGGWSGLHVLFIALSIFSLLFFVDVSRKLTNVWLTLVMSLLMLPFIVQRLEVRPEAFSYLFIGYYVWLLYRVLSNELDRRWLWVLPAVQTLWANTHVYFVFGLFVIGIFGVPSLLRKDWPLFLLLLKVGLASALTSLITPFGLEGLLYPFVIFGNYGYEIVENQSVLFLENWGMEKPSFWLLRIWSAVVLLGIAEAVWRKRWQNDTQIPLFILGLTVTCLAWFALRNFTLFGLVLIPVGSVIAYRAWHSIQKDIPEDWEVAVPLGCATLALLVVGSQHVGGVQTAWARAQLGILPGNDDAIAFIKEHAVPQPIFNNYDNGGYLIHGLHPEYKVFVDNRPEAYPTAFFTEVYIPMQEDEVIWHQQLAKHDFQSIIFYYRDLTPWAQTFLKNRIEDAAWSAVYADQQNVILVRNVPEHQELINAYYIDKSIFSWQ